MIFYDINEEKLLELERQGFAVSREVCDAVLSPTVSFVCVPTPTVNGKMDFSYLENATENIAEVLRRADNYHVVAIRSTVLPSVTRKRVLPLLKERSGSEPGRDFGVCANPEFLRRATALQDFLNPARIVIGELDKRSGDTLENLYSFVQNKILRTDLDTAEIIKCVSNAFLASKISFFNETYLICEKLGIDPQFVSEAVALDPRIGNYGIEGGRPFEGSCLPKDLEAFVTFINDLGMNPHMLDGALHVNQEFLDEKKKMGENR